MELCGIVEVEGVGLLHAVLLAQHGDVVAFALDGEVTGKADGIEHGKAVLIDVVLSRAAYFANDSYLLVVETDDDYGVEDELVFENDVLDVFGNLVACLALDIYLAQCGEVDVAALIDSVGEACLVVASVVGRACEVEWQCQFVILAVDVDGELVAYL